MTRLCFLCGKKIGFLHALADQQYCSSAHRREARLASTQARREEEELETWSVEKSKSRRRGAGHRNQTTAGQTASIFAFLMVGGLIAAALILPGSGEPSRGPAVALDPAVQRGLLDRAGNAIGEMIRSSAPVTLHQDFNAKAPDWVTVGLKSGIDDPRNWKSPAARDLGRPSLRIWERSTALQNYQMEFMGAMEKRSLSWAFRATDGGNYYASKVVITKPGPLPNAALVRYAVMGGHEWDRVELPIPVTLERGVNYRVRMSVEGDHFITYLDGQVIGSWVDKRLSRGGVGFFADAEDPQKIAWVDVSERDSFLGRMLAHFSLFVIPPGLNEIGR